LLKEGFRVLAFDNHAHDNTPGKATDLFKQSAVQCALAKKVGPIRAIITHSFGGMVTAYSLNQGLYTQKIVCISSPSHFDFLLARFSSSLHLPKSIQNYMIKRFKNKYGDDLVERVSSTNTSKSLGHIPALLIHDENDIDVPISESEQLHQAWPNSQMIRTKDLGHRRILYDAQVIENTVNFLK
jgi:pimeloyl-ACP methyl ester carboxylesterase